MNSFDTFPEEEEGLEGRSILVGSTLSLSRGRCRALIRNTALSVLLGPFDVNAPSVGGLRSGPGIFDHCST